MDKIASLKVAVLESCRLLDEYGKLSKRSLIKRKRLRFEILEAFQDVYGLLNNTIQTGRMMSSVDRISIEDTQKIFTKFDVFLKVEMDRNLEKLSIVAEIFREIGADHLAGAKKT